MTASQSFLMRPTQAVLGLAGSLWGAGIIGVVLGAFPAIGIGLIAFVGANAVAHERHHTDKLMNWSLACFTLVRIILSWRVSQNPFLGLLEGIVIWLVYSGSKVLKKSFQAIAFGLVIGLGIAAIQAFVSVWFPPAYSWQAGEPALVKLESRVNSTRITPLDPNNAWIVRPSGNRGPGRLEFSFDIRADQEQSVNVSIIAVGLRGGRMDRECIARPEWSVCRLEANLPARTEVILVIGGYGLWKQGNTPLEFRQTSLRDLSFVPFRFFLVLSSLPRTAGMAFNPNAFGAWMATLGLLVVVSTLRWYVRLPGASFALVGILLSGSRGALIAFLVGTVFLVSSQRSRWFTWVLLPLIFFIVLVVQVFPQAIAGIRALHFLTEGANTISRLEQFHLAFESFLSNPIFGVGNLHEAMISRWTQTLTTPVEAVAHAHNLFLQVAGESGILGLTVLIFLLYMAVYRITSSKSSVAGLAVLITVLALNLVDYFFLYAPVQAAFWFALSLSNDEPMIGNLKKTILSDIKNPT